MLLFFTSLNLLNYMDRYLLAALLPVLSDEMRLSNEAAGSLVSAFVVGYVLCSPLFGYLGDRFGRPPLMAAGVLLWSVATALSGLAGGFTTMFLLRVAVGVGEGSFATLAPTYLRDQGGSPSEVNRRLSIFFIAIPVGSALGYALAGAVTAVLSWHYVFFIGAVPGLILCGFLLRFRDAERQVHERPPLAEALRRILGVSALRYAIAGYILQAFCLNGIAAFVTKLGVERGFTLQEISTYFGLILVGTGLLGTYLGGRISSAMATRNGNEIRVFFAFLGITALMGVPMLAVAFASRDPVLFLGAAAMAELCIFAGTAPINSIIVLCAPRGLAGLTQGLTITGLNLFGALLGPVLIGALADRTSLALSLQLTTIALCAAGIVWFCGTRSRGTV